MKWEGGEGKDMHLEETDAKDWDQFEVNAKKFGYKSTFDMDLYTTPLDKESAFYKANEARAARLAAEIEGKAAQTLHQAEERGQDHLFDQADEEDRYSGVHSAAAGAASSPSSSSGARSGGSVYVPPHLRKVEPAVIPPPASAAPQPAVIGPPASAAPSSPAPASPATGDGKERKKLTLNPAASAFKPGFNISFSPAPAPAPAPAAVPAPVPAAVPAAVPGLAAPSSPASPGAVSFIDKLRLAAQKYATEDRNAAPPVFVPHTPPPQQPVPMALPPGQPMQMPFVPGFVPAMPVPYGPSPVQAQQPRPFPK